VKGVPSLFFVSSATPQPKFVLCGMDNAWQSPVQLLSSQSHRRSGRLFNSTALAITSGAVVLRKITFRCSMPMRFRLAVHSSR
jgi:hypothetical protein